MHLFTQFFKNIQCEGNAFIHKSFIVIHKSNKFNCKIYVLLPNHLQKKCYENEFKGFHTLTTNTDK